MPEVITQFVTNFLAVRRRLISLVLAGVFVSFLPQQALAAGAELPPLVHDIGFSLLFAGLLAIVLIKLKVPTIVSFLLAGVVVGPIGAHFVTDPVSIDTIAQLGLVLLLFLIGLELDFSKIIASGRTIILTGLLQFPLCIAFGFAVTKILLWLGIGSEILGTGTGGINYAPLYMGFVIAASSTFLVVKLFQESFQMDTVAGRVSLGILIFQDIWSIAIIAIQPNLSNPRLGPILLSLLGIGTLTLGAVLIAKYVLPIGFRWIAKMPEVILVSAIAWCFGVVFVGTNVDVITEALFGFNLQMSVGSGMAALVAGASIANLPYSTDVVGKVGIVKDFFITLFFVALGMGIPFPDGIGVFLLAVLFSVFVIAAGYLIFLPLLYWTGLDRRNAFVTSTRLAQVSEFTLVIAYVGLGFGHITEELNAVIIITFILTALLTPLLFKHADTIHDKVGPLLDKIGFREPSTVGAAEEESYSLVLLGFHRLASSLLLEVKKSKPELLKDMLVIDFNVNIHPRIAALGPTVRYGDLANPDSLRHAGVEKARVVLITVEDDLLKGTSNARIVQEVRRINPDATIIANAIELKETAKLYRAGADYVFLPRVESARGLLPAVSFALSGGITNYRAERETAEGEWYERDEVFV